MIIKNGNVFLDGDIKKCDISFSDTVLGVGSFEGDENVIDAEGLYVFPGFVDIHTHGGFGGDFMDADEASFDKALAFHAKNGTTSLVATTVTAAIEDIEAMLDVARKYKKINAPRGARVLGVHIEGPYLSLKNKGAQHEKYLRVPSKDSYDFILRASDIIKTVTIAPELDGAPEMARALVKAGIVVCGGHDDGCYETIMPTVDAGMTHCTHIWCASSVAQVIGDTRSMGLTEIGMSSDKLTVEVIADNHHYTPDMVRIMYKLKSADKMCLVSDCLRAGGMQAGEGTYKLGSNKNDDVQVFILGDRVAKLPDGTRLAGSVQPLSEMLRNIVFDAHIPLADAVKMVTSTPAEIIGDESIGRIEVGRRADFCIMDKDLNPVMTVINGNIIKEI